MPNWLRNHVLVIISAWSKFLIRNQYLFLHTYPNWILYPFAIHVDYQGPSGHAAISVESILSCPWQGSMSNWHLMFPQLDLIGSIEVLWSAVLLSSISWTKEPAPHLCITACHELPDYWLPSQVWYLTLDVIIFWISHSLFWNLQDPLSLF